VDLAIQITSIAIALGALFLSILVYVRQQRANAHADVSVWFETHERSTFMVIKNHGPGVARKIQAEFFDVEGQPWEPRRDIVGTQFPLFPVDVLAAGEWIERSYHHVLSTPTPLMTHLTWFDRRRELQLKKTWSGQRYSRG